MRGREAHLSCGHSCSAVNDRRSEAHDPEVGVEHDEFELLECPPMTLGALVHMCPFAKSSLRTLREAGKRGKRTAFCAFGLNESVKLRHSCHKGLSGIL